MVERGAHKPVFVASDRFSPIAAFGGSPRRSAPSLAGISQPARMRCPDRAAAMVSSTPWSSSRSPALVCLAPRCWSRLRTTLDAVADGASLRSGVQEPRRMGHWVGRECRPGLPPHRAGLDRTRGTGLGADARHSRVPAGRCCLPRGRARSTPGCRRRCAPCVGRRSSRRRRRRWSSRAPRPRRCTGAPGHDRALRACGDAAEPAADRAQFLPVGARRGDRRTPRHPRRAHRGGTQPCRTCLVGHSGVPQCASWSRPAGYISVCTGSPTCPVGGAILAGLFVSLGAWVRDALESRSNQ